MNCAAGHQPDIKIGRTDRDQAAPGEEHVALVEKTEAAPGGKSGFAEGGAGEAVEFASRKVTQRVARKRVEREQNHIRSQNQSADSNPKMAVEIEGLDSVMPEKQDEHDREVKEIAMNVLQDKGKPGLALILAFGRLADRASRRIEKKSPVIRFSVVVAGGTKTERPGEDQQRRRKFPPMMQRIDQRRIKRRKIGAPLVKLPFKGAKRGIEAKAAKKNNYGQDFDPPGVAAQRASEPRFWHQGWRASHLGTSRLAVRMS